MRRGNVHGARLPVLIFLLLLAVPLPFLPEYGGANSSTRLMLTAELVETGSTQIDRHAALTSDKAERDGHFYSDKAPGMALMAVPVYAAGRAINLEAAEALFRFGEPLAALPRSSMLLYRAIVWLTGGLLMALAGSALFTMCRHLDGTPKTALLAVLSVCLATPVLGWSVQFFGHIGAGASLAIAFALCTGFARTQTSLDPATRALAAGAALSLAVSIEYTAAPPALMIVFYAIWLLTHLPRAEGLRLFFLAFGAALFAAAPMLIYHWVSFGSPFRVGYSNVVGYVGMKEGFLGLRYPDPVVLWKITFGLRRGIIWLSPLLVLVPWGLWMGIKNRGHRAETLLCLAIIVYYFLLNASYFYWGGGASVGPRHVMPAMFFMALPLLGVWTAAKGRIRQMLKVLFGVSLFFSLASASVTMTVNGSWRFPLKDPILENLLTDQNAFLRYADWGISPPLIIGVWIAVCLGLVVMLWQRSTIMPGKPAEFRTL